MSESVIKDSLTIYRDYKTLRWIRVVRHKWWGLISVDVPEKEWPGLQSRCEKFIDVR